MYKTTIIQTLKLWLATGLLTVMHKYMIGSNLFPYVDTYLHSEIRYGILNFDGKIFSWFHTGLLPSNRSFWIASPLWTSITKFRTHLKTKSCYVFLVNLLIFLKKIKPHCFKLGHYWDPFTFVKMSCQI